jgi:hypothetical protein
MAPLLPRCPSLHLEGFVREAIRMNRIIVKVARNR